MTTDTVLDTELLAVQARWSRHLLARLDMALELGAEPLDVGVADAWRSLVRDQPEAHALLLAHAGDPVLRRARRSMLTAVAVAAGLATFDDPPAVAAAAGERLLAVVEAEGAPGHGPFPWAA